jgi:hypothetical protein
MKAGEKKLNDLLHAGNQFVIPVFQRDYVWRERDWERLWEDIESLRESDGPAEHFMGSIVSVQMDSQPGEIPRYLIIDGQQRLITFAMLLSALRDEAARCGVDTLPEKIQRNFLTHDLEKDLSRYKILPRLRDRISFFQLVDGQERPGKRSRVVEAYDYFSARLADVDGDKEATLKEIFTAVTAKLSLVTITLDREQNAFAIFATLNATGQKLEEADLIRNFVFMDVPLSKQDRFDHDDWLPFETRFDAGGGYPAVSLTSFYRDFLMRRGEYVRRDGVYVSFQRDEGVKGASRTELLGLLQRYAELYLWIERPPLAPTHELRRELIRFTRLEQSTANPLVLDLLFRHKYEALTEEELLRCLQAITSFILRRAMTNWSTRAYGRLFTGAIGALEDETVLSSLSLYLARKGWPNDVSFIDELITFPVYRKWPSLTRLMLVAVEDPDAHRERVDVDGLLDKGDLSIEHVMPQTIGNDKAGRWWQAELGDSLEDVQREWLHTIGNLTLTGYNPKLSNRELAWKKAEFAKSNLRLNRWFVSTDHWTGTEIAERAKSIANDVVALWPEAAKFEPKAGDVKLDPGEGPVRPSATMAPFRREFWEYMAPACEAAGAPLRLTPSSDTWLLTDAGFAKGTVYAIARTSKGTLAVQFNSNWYPTESLFNWLRAHQDGIRSAFEQAPMWVNTPGSYQQYFEVTRFADLADKSSWPEHRDWIIGELMALQKVLWPLVGRLPRREAAPEPTMEAFLADIADLNPPVAGAATRLADWAAREMPEPYLSVNRGRLSWIPQISTRGKSYQIVRLMSDGTIEFRFRMALKKEPLSAPGLGKVLLERVNSIPGVRLPEEALTSTVSLPLAMMNEPAAFDALRAVLNWYVDKVHGDGSGE